MLAIAWAPDSTALYSSGGDHALARLVLAGVRTFRHPPFGAAFRALAERGLTLLERPVPPPDE